MSSTAPFSPYRSPPLASLHRTHTRDSNTTVPTCASQLCRVHNDISFIYSFSNMTCMYPNTNTIPNDQCNESTMSPLHVSEDGVLLIRIYVLTSSSTLSTHRRASRTPVVCLPVYLPLATLSSTYVVYTRPCRTAHNYGTFQTSR